ncbi:hypothetical protein [Cryobacterium sp. MLB-32]|uniref:hypothetical protein n=1 Tax=Cryobacterium sp. MLB-32 TaxID=1529318 RepID=UPI0012E00A2F|nr:hypothetical protein [Cryobacterium sp. MLB-32]
MLLHSADTTTTRHLSLTLNKHGELPVLLVDPLDDNGTVIPGMWLNHNVENIVYLPTGPARTGHLRDWAARERHRATRFFSSVKQFFSR